MNMVMSRRVRAAAGAAGAAAAVLLAVGCGSSSSSSAAAPATAPATPSGTASSATASAPAGMAAVLKTEHTKLGVVLADSKGFTLYWFAKDTPTTSACSGACATAWPPVIGTPQAASGVTLSGKLGTIKRPDGSLQATYNGHPLYLFVADKAAGQANGNNVDGFGAKWYAIPVGGSGTAATPSSTGGGY
ncbi:MAG: hypothetical protein JO132_01285 [Streptosporangiaceae bacterium]|nr:hypothetical protein [Streptosporangiaceae bacterium]